MSEIDDDLGAPFQPAAGTLVITASKVRDLGACPRRYGLAHVLRLSPDADANEQTDELALGLALHAELKLRHADPTTHDQDGFVDPMSPMSPWISHRAAAHRALCPSVVSSGAVSYVDGECDLQWFRPRRNVIVRGRIDALWLHDDGTLEVRDYKSGHVPDDLRDDPAALLYGLLALTHPIATSKHRVRAVRVSYEALRAEQSKVVSLDFDASVVADAIRLVQVTDERIRAEQNFGATPSPSACRTCSFRITCPFSAARENVFP
jgi:hypothetical protein